MLLVQSIFFMILTTFIASPVWADAEAYQHAIDQVAAPGTQCWRLQRNPELSADEFARVRAFCWHRHNPELVRNNPVYNSKVLSGVREQETSAERTSRIERETRAEEERRVAYESWLQSEKEEKAICLDPTNFGAGDYEWVPGDFRVNSNGYCTCRAGLHYYEGGDNSFYCTEEVICEQEQYCGSRDNFGGNELSSETFSRDDIGTFSDAEQL